MKNKLIQNFKSELNWEIGLKSLRNFSILLLIALFNINGAQAQTYDTCVKADYKFATSNLDVKFEAKGSGPILLWTWDFGDKTRGAGKNIKHTYKKAGTYKVCLTVYGFDTATQKRCRWIACKKVTVKAPCNLAAKYGFITDGLTAKFEAKYMKNVVYSWDFGDKSTTKGRLAKHTYKKAGTYVVCLKMVDTITKCSAKVCQKVTVKAKCNLTTDFKFTNSGGDYKFEASSNSKNVSYRWFINYTTSSGKTAKYTFPKSGTYKVCVFAYDSITKCKAEKCTTIVYKSPCDTLKGEFTWKSSGLKFGFSAKSNSKNAAFGWRIDTNFYRGQTIRHTFSTHGYHKVCLIVKDTVTGCMFDVCKKIYIKNPCDTIKLGISSRNSGNIYKFEAQSNSNNNVYVWTLNGRPAARGASYKDTLTKPGKYVVCVTAKDTVLGCKKTACKYVYIKDPCDTFRVKIEMARKDSIVKFEAASNSNNNAYYWTLNGKPVARGDGYKDTFTKPGIYKICLIAKDTVNGCKADACKTIVIKDPCDTLKLGFEYKNSGPLYKFGAFSNSKNAVYSWTVNGKFKTRGASWSDTFPRKGGYKICVTIKDTLTGCTKVVCKEIKVGDKCDYLEANFKFTNKGYKYNFVAKSTAKRGKYYWSFGDGKYGRGRNKRHTYKMPGVYNVCLTVVDLKTKCKVKICKKVVVKKSCYLKADFAFRTNGGKVKFKARSNANNVKYVWTYGDGTFGKGKRSRHKYAKSGTYTVCLVAIQANGCTVTVCKRVKVTLKNGKMIAPSFDDFDQTEPSMSVDPKMITWDVSMSPNPVSQKTTVTVTNIDASKIEVYDIAGNKVMDINPQDSRDVDMGELDRGFYFIRAYDEYGNVKTVKFLKN